MSVFSKNISKQNKLLETLINAITDRLNNMEIDADMADLNLSGENTPLHLTLFENMFQSSNGKDESDQKYSTEVDENNSEKPNSVMPRRSSRRKMVPIREMDKQHLVSTAKKSLDSSNFNELKKYYTNKNTKRLSSALETIFEDSVASKSGSVTTISSRKYKRVLSFGDCSSTNIGKIRKRQLKAKKICKSKRKKMSMNLFKKKLKDILDSDEYSDSQS